MTERLHFHVSLLCIGEGNGNPLQCSCLENPRDGGPWWAAVYGVAQSRTQVKRLSSIPTSPRDSLPACSKLRKTRRIDPWVPTGGSRRGQPPCLHWPAWDASWFCLIVTRSHGMRRGVVTHTAIDSLNFVILFIMNFLHEFWLFLKYCLKM